MKAFGKILAALGVVALSAFAPAPAMAQKWEGFYAGIQGGTARFNSSLLGDGTVQSPSLKDSSGFIGVTAGYNWQTGPWVAGVELDWSKTDFQVPANTYAYCLPSTCSSRMDWFATARLRAGYAISPVTMIYATGGAAFAELGTRIDFALAIPAVEVMSVKNGWTIGAGVESMLAQHWSVKLEYLYLNFQDALPMFNGFATNFQTTDPNLHVVRAGLNYKF